MAAIGREFKAVRSLDGEERSTVMAREGSGGLRPSFAGGDSWRRAVQAVWTRAACRFCYREGRERGGWRRGGVKIATVWAALAATVLYLREDDKSTVLLVPSGSV